MPSRILHVMWTLEIGGAERAVYQLVREQRRAGLTVDVAVAWHAGYYAERASEAGATIFELRQRSAYDPFVSRRTRDLFRRYDVVHFHSAEPLLAAVAANAGTPTFYTHRSGQFAYPAKQALRYRLMKPFLRRRFAGLSGNSRHAVKVAARLFGISASEIALTYNGLDFSLLDPTRPLSSVLEELPGRTSSYRVATTGNLRDWKRIDLLIQAMLAADESIHCYIVGDGPDRARLEQITTALGLGERVWFLGKKTNVADYLQAMDAFVLPSGHEEAFGNSAVESMALGLPTIVFADSDGLREHVHDDVTGFTVSGVADLAETLNRLQADRTLGTRIGAAGSAYVRETYTVERMIAAYNSLYATARRSRAAETPSGAIL